MFCSRRKDGLFTSCANVFHHVGFSISFQVSLSFPFEPLQPDLGAKSLPNRRYVFILFSRNFRQIF